MLSLNHLHHTFLRTGFILLLSVLALATSAQDESYLSEVTSVETSAFPEMTVEVAVRSNSGQIIQNLGRSAFTISEAASGVISLNTRDSQNILLGIVVDVGDPESPDNESTGDDELQSIRRTLRAYLENYYRDGDVVIFVEHDDRNSRGSILTSRAEIDQAIDALTPRDIPARIDGTLNQLLTQIQGLRGTYPALSPQVMVLTTYLQSNAEEESEAFGDAGIPLHAIHVHQVREDFTAAVQGLASLGGGRFADNQNEQLLLPQGNTFVPTDRLQTLFETIDANRNAYVLTYDASITGFAENRSASVTVSESDVINETLPYSYSITYDEPNVTILTGESNLDITRTARTDSEFDINTATVRLDVGFNDIDRAVTRIDMDVEDRATGETLQDFNNLPFQQEQGTYVVDWNLGYYNTEGTREVRLIITVEDEAGKTASAQAPASVAVNPIVIGPTNTPLPTATLAPTATPLPTATPVIGFVPVENQGDILNIGLGVFGLVFASTLLLGAFSFFLVFTDSGKRFRQGAVQVAEGTARRAGTAIAAGGKSAMRVGTKIFGGNVASDPSDPDSPPTSSEAIAILDVLKGAEKETFEINSGEYTIGRLMQAGCDATIDNPYVSDIHCKINYNSQLSSFMIKDVGSDNQGSSNGTVVDGDLLEPMEPRELSHNAKIQLGPEVELLFKVRKRKGEIPTDMLQNVQSTPAENDTSSAPEGQVHESPDWWDESDSTADEVNSASASQTGTDDDDTDNSSASPDDPTVDDNVIPEEMGNNRPSRKGRRLPRRKQPSDDDPDQIYEDWGDEL